MKKLIIAATIICAAVVSQAVTFKWGTDFEVMNGTDSGITSATTAYLIDSAVLSQSSIYDAVMGGASLADAVSGKTLSTAAMDGGLIDVQSKMTLPAGYNAGDNLTAYMVVFDSDLNALYFAEEITKVIPSAKDATFLFQNDSSLAGIAADMSGFSASAGGWVQTVPEPTSGLLLLLGMAGLALKRKQA